MPVVVLFPLSNRMLKKCNLLMVFLKAVKPRTGVFCFLLHEARQASELEMPDADNVFMVKVR